MCSETIYVTNVYFKCIICFIIQAWQHLWDNVFIKYFIRKWIYSQQNTDVSRSEPKRSMLCRIVGALRHSCLLGPPTSVTCLRCTTCILLYVIIQVLMYLYVSKISCVFLNYTELIKDKGFWQPMCDMATGVA